MPWLKPGRSACGASSKMERDCLEQSQRTQVQKSLEHRLQGNQRKESMDHPLIRGTLLTSVSFSASFGTAEAGPCPARTLTTAHRKERENLKHCCMICQTKHTTNEREQEKVNQASCEPWRHGEAGALCSLPGMLEGIQSQLVSG